MTDDKIVRLRELPVTVNVTKMAEGIKEMFTEEELTVLKFGMLPAKKMEILETNLRERFEKLGKHPREVWDHSTIADTYHEDARLSTVETDGESNVVEWRLDRLVSEAVHEITLGIYAIGELVV